LENSNNRIGEVNYNKSGLEMIIVEYNNYKNITVHFTKSGSYIKTRYDHFTEGSTKDPYDKTIFSIGYLGIGKYKSSKNKNKNIQYYTWRNMFVRCYSEEYRYKFPSYINCTVSNEWYNYQNFGKWYDENYYDIENQRMELDKDILHKGNKIYSPKTCVFVPRNINCLFTKRESERGKYPIGVYYREDNNKYMASCNNGNGINEFLGIFNNKEKAFEEYKNYKENLIKTIAEKYKNTIPEKLYKAMYKYKVNIYD